MTSSSSFYHPGVSQIHLGPHPHNVTLSRLCSSTASVLPEGGQGKGICQLSGHFMQVAGLTMRSIIMQRKTEEWAWFLLEINSGDGGGDPCLEDCLISLMYYKMELICRQVGWHNWLSAASLELIWVLYWHPPCRPSCTNTEVDIEHVLTLRHRHQITRDEVKGLSRPTWCFYERALWLTRELNMDHPA